MKPSQTRVWLLWTALLVLAILLKPVQDRVDARVGQTSQILDVLYFGESAVVKGMALGYDSLLADIYWMRAIQYYGRRDRAARRVERYRNLAPLLDITVTLDPQLLDAYRFGGFFLAEPEPLGAGQPEEAIKLLDKGILRHPLAWRLHFDKGFTYFWFLKDYQKAGEVWLSASRLETAPPWMEGLAATALSRSGAVETARALWERQYEESEREDVRDNAKNHLLSLQVDEERWTLEFFVEKYHTRFGKFPDSLRAMAPLFLKAIPDDPSGTPYRYDPKAGTVRLSPSSKMKYLEMPYDYYTAFRQKLIRDFGPHDSNEPQRHNVP